MKSFKFIVLVLFLLGCNSSEKPINPESFNYKTSGFFFKADVKAEYRALLAYFRKVKTLEEVESGWTVYPPLSALRQEHSNSVTKSFAFNTYLDVTSRIKNGRLSVKKFGPAKDAMAVLELNLEFKLINDAEVFYKKVISDFNAFHIIYEEPLSENISSALIRDTGTESILKIELFFDKSSEFYLATLRLIMDES